MLDHVPARRQQSGDDWRPLDNLEDKEYGQITVFDGVVAGGS
jgi:hypothetical protein